MAGTGAYNPIPSHVGRVLFNSCLGSCGWIGREEVREAETYLEEDQTECKHEKSIEKFDLLFSILSCFFGLYILLA